ncbi:ferritin-like domain-containing protein [Haloplanus sp.]|uniref:ferritin-like domain-containing protein n=1 Tax=Haloplanus sp. TaxID=1961696 RepID=UPI002607E58C|nr:ferritin-like domain-containing protein [Haloplanus sp.]
MVRSNADDGDTAEQDSNDSTRRQFAVGSAGVLGGLAVGGALSESAMAQVDDGSGDGGDGDTSEEPAFEDDVAVLNYALTLEYLEARFYQRGLDNIGEEDLCNCKALAEDSYLRDRVFDELRTIQAHEETHIETLVATIEDLGGDPIDEPAFDFGVRVEYPMAFLGTAVQLEDAGVSAYAGAAPAIENEDLIPPALSIHSVEARHASFLRTVSDQTGFPNAFDEARSKAEVLDVASTFIVDPEASDTDSDTDSETETETETETGTENGTETGTGTGNETDSGTETETGTETGTGTDSGTGNETDPGTETA